MYLQDKVNDINHRLEAVKNFSSIVIWGAGRHTGELFEKTDLLTYSIKSIVDIDPNKQDGSFFGFRIKNPGEIVWDDVDAVVISVIGKETLIMETLENELGFSGNIITLYEKHEITPFFNLYDKKKSEIRYTGDYAEWKDAYKECRGYEDENIINTVISASEKVINGDAVWERDGCLFYEQKYDYHICASILKCAVQNKNQGVRVLDIGGSLGSTYFQNRKYWMEVRNLEYVVAEQDHFTKYGKEYLEDGVLKFIRSSENYATYGRFDIMLMSGSLQYIGQYEEIVDKIVKARPRYIILDRIPIGNRRRICKEEVPEKIYKSSYPLWIFNEDEMNNFFGDDYKIIEKDMSSVTEDRTVYFADGAAPYRYYVFQNIYG